MLGVPANTTHEKINPFEVLCKPWDVVGAYIFSIRMTKSCALQIMIPIIKKLTVLQPVT